jgi:hypothetical protein
MQTMTRVSDLTDLYICTGKIGQPPPSGGCFTWHKALRLAALELWRRGEAVATLITLKAGRQTVRHSLGRALGS